MAVTINGTTGITTTGDYDAEDGDKILLGTDDDLQIYHDGSNSYIEAINTGAGDLIVQGTGKKIKLRPKSGEEGVVVIDDGAVELYYDGVKKFETNQYGNKSFQHLYMDDSHKLQLGSDQDLQIYHDGSDSIIKHDGTGTLKIQTGSSQEDVMIQGGRDVYLQVGADATAETAIRCIDNAGVELYDNNILKFKSYSGGTYTYGDCNIAAAEGVSAAVYLIADEGDDNGDVWRMVSNHDVNDLTLANNTSGSHANKLTLTKEGNISVAGSGLSDRDLKDNIATVTTTALDKIKQLVPKTYTWKTYDNNRTFTGFIAQDVKEVLPILVSGTDGEKNMALDYNGVLAYAVKAITELSAEVDTLKTEKTKLQTDLTALTARVAALEAA